MPFAGFPDWETCEREMRKKHGVESAKKICGFLKAKHEKKDNLINECIQLRMNQLKDLEEHENRSLKDIMIDAYHECKDYHDFEFLTLEEYDFIRDIAVTLQESGSKEYIITDQMILSNLMLSNDFRVEPMQTLAEAATAGARSSSNIGKIGYFNNVLEVEFKNGVRYIYFVEDSFYDDLASAESKGKWLWENLRGKTPGLVYPGKDPNRATPGGMKGTLQGGAIVPYARRSVMKAARRVSPSGRVEPLIPKARQGTQLEKESNEQKSFFGQLTEKAFQGLKFLKQKILGMKKNARDFLLEMEIQEDAFNELIEWILEKGLTTSRDEAEEIALLILQSRKKKGKGKGSSHEWEEEWDEIAEIFEKRRQKRKEQMKASASSETIETMFKTKKDAFSPDNQKDLIIRNESWNTLSDLGMCSKKFGLVYDFYHEDDELKKQALKQKLDHHHVHVGNDSLMFGVISQAGKFKYKDKNGKFHYKEKKWDNLVENVNAHPILPLFGRNGIGSHEESDETLLGYVDNFILDHENQRFGGFFHTFRDIEELSALRDPKDLSVSLSFYDRAPKDSPYQDIVGLRHVAISLDNTEMDRCSTVEKNVPCVANKLDLVSSSSQETHHFRQDGFSSREKSSHAHDLISSDYNLTKDFASQSNENVKLSSHSTIKINDPHKIITRTRLIDMTEKDEQIARILADFETKISEDALRNTGNETKGHTLEDIFKRACADQAASPDACNAAWEQYNSNNPHKTPPKVSMVTGGHQSTKVDFIQISQKEYETLLTKANEQEDLLTRVETLEKESRANMEKTKQYDIIVKNVLEEKNELMKKPWRELLNIGEENDLFQDFSNEIMEQWKPVYDLLIEHYPELIKPLNGKDLGNKNLTDIKKDLEINMKRSNDFTQEIEDLKKRALDRSRNLPFNKNSVSRGEK